MKPTELAKSLADMPETLEEAREILALVDDSPSASRVKIANLQSENAKLRKHLTALVQSCTPMAMPTDSKHYGTRAPDKEILEAARKMLG